MEYNIQDGRGLEYIKPSTVSKVLRLTQHIQTITRELRAESYSMPSDINILLSLSFSAGRERVKVSDNGLQLQQIPACYLSLQIAIISRDKYRIRANRNTQWSTLFLMLSQIGCISSLYCIPCFWLAKR